MRHTYRSQNGTRVVRLHRYRLECVRVRFMVDTVAPVAGRHSSDAAPVPGRHLENPPPTRCLLFRFGRRRPRMRRRPVVLRELGLVEQRYQAVREVLNDGATVTDVARRHGVSRQTVHEWLVRYANKGLPPHGSLH